MLKRLILGVFLYSLNVQDGGEGQRQDIVSSMGIVGEWGAVPVGTSLCEMSDNALGACVAKPAEFVMAEDRHAFWAGREGGSAEFTHVRVERQLDRHGAKRH